ncbi:MAG: ATP-binding protein [Pseudoxanthomonas sp.]
MAALLLACLATGPVHATGASAKQRVPEMPRFRNLTVADGLPSNSILSVATDKHGYLWIGSSDGLARYDGVDFTIWRHDAKDPASLPSNTIQWVYPDDRGRIYVAGESAGVSYLDTATNQFHSLYKKGQGPIPHDGIFSIVSREGEYWFAGMSDAGVWRMRADGKVDHYTKENTSGGLPSSDALVVQYDQTGRLWAGTDVGVSYFDGETFVHVPLPVDTQPMVLSLSQAGRFLWAGTSEGVFRLDAAGIWKAVPWSRMFQHDSTVWSIGTTNDGGYWIGSPKGLWRTHGDDAPVPISMQDAVPIRTVTGFANAPNGGLWISRLGLGLSYLRPDWQRIASYVPDPDRSDGVHCGLLKAAEDPGLWQFDAHGRLEHLEARTGMVVATPWTYPQLAKNNIASGTEDGRNGLWLVSLGYGLVRIDLETGAQRVWKPDDKVDAMSEYVPTQILARRNGTVWVRTPVSKDIQIRDARSGKIVGLAKPTKALPLTMWQMSLDPADNVWFSNEGMIRWRDDVQRFEQVPGFGEGDIYSFAFADPDHAWLHSAKGLEFWEQRQGRWQRRRRLEAGSDLPEIESIGMQLDRSGRVWLATRRGLLRINPRHADGSFDVRVFGVRDGMKSQDFLDHCLKDLGHGIFTTAAADGSNIILDTELPDPIAGSPPLQIEQVTVMRNGQRLALPISGGFRLLPSDRELQVEARVLAYDDPLANRYRTRLSGFDPGWIDHGNSGTRVLSSLKPGSYRLDMQGIDAMGSVSSVISMSFSVAPPWYASAWGITMLLLSLLLFALWSSWAYRGRLRRKASWQLAVHKREVAEQASLAKTRFLATLGHEVRTPMTGVLGMSELLLETSLDTRQRNYAGAIQSAGKHLLRLVNDALDLARIEAGKLPLDQQDFELRALIGEVTVLVRPMAERKQLQFDCTLAQDTPQVLRGDPARIRQILLNLLLNAVKFTEHGRVGLSIAALQPEGVRFEVSDTGPGVSLEQQARIFQRFEQAEGARTAARYGGSGLGLAICQELAVAMGGQVQVHSVLGQGTRFAVLLPLPVQTGEVALAELDPMRVQPERLIRILLVEDDQTVADVIRGLLESRGHQVDHAVHGLAALTEVAMHHYDFALLDLDLPGLDGLALARQLRAQGFVAPMMAVTARADGEAETLAMEAGFDGFLRKPLTGALLLKAMRAAWSRSQSDQASA